MCSEGCSACHGNAADGYSEVCDTCSTGFTITNGVCEGQCGEGTYLNSESGECDFCDFSCVNCNGPANTNCLPASTCAEGFNYDKTTSSCLEQTTEAAL